MDKLVCVCFQFISALILALRGAAEYAFAILPGVLDALIADIALGIVKMRYRELTVGVFGAVYATAREQAGQFGNGNAIQLLMENVIQPVLQVWHLRLPAYNQALGDLSQKHTRFAGRVQEGGIWVPKQLLRQRIQHLVDDIRRRENLIV